MARFIKGTDHIANIILEENDVAGFFIGAGSNGNSHVNHDSGIFARQMS